MVDISDVVELAVDLPNHNLRAGARGTVVHLHDGNTYEVEFTNEYGDTLDFLALRHEQFIVVWRVETNEWVSLPEQAVA
jgi:hypothetical protein